MKTPTLAASFYLALCKERTPTDYKRGWCYLFCFVEINTNVKKLASLHFVYDIRDTKAEVSVVQQSGKEPRTNVLNIIRS